MREKAVDKEDKGKEIDVEKAQGKNSFWRCDVWSCEWCVSHINATQHTHTHTHSGEYPAP